MIYSRKIKVHEKYRKAGFMFFSSNKIKARKMAFQLFWLVVLITHFCVYNVSAQSKKSNLINFANCETMVAGLGQAMNDFVKNAKPDSYLVIIGGAMKGEKPSYNSRRIQAVIGYINWGAKTKDDRINFGIGTPETNAGYLRFYVNGILSEEIKFRKNDKLCWADGREMKF